jgi:hypothetical protein
VTPAQAAKILGCSTGHVRLLCNRGIIKAKKVKPKHQKVKGSFFYDIAQEEVERYKQKEHDGRGWPRGVPRSNT